MNLTTSSISGQVLQMSMIAALIAMGVELHAALEPLCGPRDR